MNRERFLPTVLLNGREGAWEVLRSIIIGELLPRLDRVGVSLFLPPLQPAPPDAQMVPFQDIWVRSRPPIIPLNFGPTSGQSGFSLTRKGALREEQGAVKHQLPFPGPYIRRR